MVRAYDINDATIKAVTTIFLSNTHAYGISHWFVERYIRVRLGEEIYAANDKNVENFAQVVPEHLEFMMPAPDIMEALEWQEQHQRAR